MLSHEQIWAAIDKLAAAHDFTTSGLAKRAGLDSTTFNKSKRFAPDGRARWPSTESLAKIMEATGISLQDFTSLVEGRPAVAYFAESNDENVVFSGFNEQQANYDAQASLADIPVLGMAQAGAGGFFDEAGFPAGQGWDQVHFPGLSSKGEIYALEISGDSMLPLYREGDTIIVSPVESVRRGDRVVVKTKDGEVMAKILKRQTSTRLELSSVNSEYEDRSFAMADIDWVARILWASQ